MIAQLPGQLPYLRWSIRVQAVDPDPPQDCSVAPQYGKHKN